MTDTVDEPSEWQQGKYPGVRYRTLRYERDTGAGAVLIEMAADTTYGAHRHSAGEDVLVLEGDLVIGAQTYHAGDYVYSPPGSIHAPRSRSGCVLFATFPGRIEHLDPSPSGDP